MLHKAELFGKVHSDLQAITKKLASGVRVIFNDLTPVVAQVNAIATILAAIEQPALAAELRNKADRTKLSKQEQIEELKNVLKRADSAIGNWFTGVS